MGYFTWNEKLDIGVDHMNGEHKIILDTMNKLVEMTQAGKPTAEIRKVSDDLANYAIGHFAREEEYMKSVNYPGTKQHIDIHKKLLERFGKQKAEFDQDPQARPELFFKFLEVWLFSHIQGIDKDYGQHVAKNKKAS